MVFLQPRPPLATLSQVSLPGDSGHAFSRPKSPTEWLDRRGFVEPNRKNKPQDSLDIINAGSFHVFASYERRLGAC
jgi:hypothetical protein